MKQYIKITFKVLLSIGLLTSCDDLLEVDPEEVLLAEDYLGADELDARSALFGVLSEMQDITEQYIVLGEMRADLVDINEETVDDLIQLSNHENIDEDNTYIDPTKLFSIINNCNYAIDRMDIEANDGRLLPNFVSMVRIRTWAQMQVLINYGKLPYIVTPVTSDKDFKEQDKYEVYGFEQALDLLIANLENIIDFDNVDTYENSLGYSIESMIPDNNILLGDLHLWRGNYFSAAGYYKDFLDNTVDGGPIYLLDNYSTVVGDIDADFTTRWNLIFTDFLKTDEVINYTAYSDQFRQQNTGFDVLTSQLSASGVIKEQWGNQTLLFEDEFVTEKKDSREGESLDLSLEKIDKYSEEYFTWNRAATIYLRFAEAINREGFPEEALEIVNGIFSNPNLNEKSALILTTNASLEFSSFAFDDVDYFGVETTGDTPIEGQGFLGVRGRVGLSRVGLIENPFVDVDEDGLDDDTGEEKVELTTEEKIIQVEDLIINEAALELAFEGNRWGDLLRVSKRRNDNTYIANAVARKFDLKGDQGKAESIREFLKTDSNLYLHLEIPTTFKNLEDVVSKDEESETNEATE